MAQRRVLLIAGAVSYDYLLFPDPTQANAIGQHSGEDAAHLTIRAGHADFVAQLLLSAAPVHGLDVMRPVLQPPTTSILKPRVSSIVDLLPNGRDANGQLCYQVVGCRSIGRPPTWHAPAINQATASLTPSTVIVSGSGETFRNFEPALDFLQGVRPRYIIHHMSKPLAIGALWDFVRDGPRTRDGPPDPEFLAVILDADDLRDEGIALSQGLSWEATAEDFVRNLGSNGRLDTLVTCPNLIVRFGTEGVIHHRGRDATDPRLYYHPKEVEGAHCDHKKVEMVGLASAFTAGFALGFADTKHPNNDRGLKLGIAAARRLSDRGFVQNTLDEAPDYPIAQLMDKLQPNKAYVSVSIPSARISSGDRWSIFDSVTGDPAEVARLIVTDGPDRALANCPVQTFGQLRAIERTEQESLRAVVGAVQERLKQITSRPTSVGVIGPSGSGKKFTARNLVLHISRDRPTIQLSYDVRLMQLEELVTACHTIRDSTADGALTTVIFENFEAALDPNHKLSKNFMGIMREGRFTDKGGVHTIGATLMFFIINREESSVQKALVSSQMPSLSVSSDLGVGRLSTDDNFPMIDDLHGLIRVVGPNPLPGQEKMSAIRRALMLRQLLIEKHPHLVVDGEIKVDEAVLHALLFVPSYKHGLRSLEKIVATSRLSGRRKFDVAALPPEEQIQLHVDGPTFMSYLRAPKLIPTVRERLAEGLFEAYRKQRLEMALSPESRAEIAAERSMQDWDELPADLKESTRAQADDIPRKLRAVNCFMLEEDRGDPLVRVHEFTESNLDLLSEMEHERFNAERLQRQWRMGPRNSKQRTTPFLIPWRDLAQEWREVDRVMVECVPRILAKYGWKIYRMREDEDDDDDTATDIKAG